jgi:hypothetical protein
MAIGADGFIEQRIETLYVCDEYKLFFLTGQANGTGRSAYIAAKAFHAMDDATLEEMRKNAEPWTERGSSVQISPNQGMLAFSDRCTGTVTNVPWAELDEDVQQRLRGKIADPFMKYAGDGSKTVRNISVSRPLALKRNP